MILLQVFYLIVSAVCVLIIIACIFAAMRESWKAAHERLYK